MRISAILASLLTLSSCTFYHQECGKVVKVGGCDKVGFCSALLEDGRVVNAIRPVEGGVSCFAVKNEN